MLSPASPPQAHPPSEDELRELALRQQEAAEERKGAKRDKELADLREALPWIDPTEVERVWRACECNRPRVPPLLRNLNPAAPKRDA